MPYNGEEQKVEGYDVEISNDLYTEDDFTFSGEAVAKGTDVDEYPMGLADTQFTNNNDNFDVTFAVTDGKLIINNISAMEIIAKIVWEDDNDRDGKRSGVDAIMQLYKTVGGNTEAVGEAISVPYEDGIVYTWKDLPVSEDGQKIQYSVKETLVTPNTYSIRNPATIRKLMRAARAAAEITELSANVDLGNEVTFTTVHNPEIISISVTKIWDDADNEDGIRPDSISVALSGGDDNYDAELDDSTKWTYSFDGLYKYADGAEIVYELTEEPVDGYESNVTGDAETGFTITNTHTPEEKEPETSKVTITKRWADNYDADGMRPEEITVIIKAENNDSIPEKRVTITADKAWQTTVTLKTTDADGNAIEYSVTEVEVDGYSSSVTEKNGNYTIINYRASDKTDVSVAKVWNDNNDSDGIRPVSILVQLYAEGSAIGSQVRLNAANNWTYTWKNLDANKDGRKIEYSVMEVRTPIGYISSVSTVSENNFIITNTHEQFTTEVSVAKIWDDENNADGIRPESIIVTLSDGTKEVEKITLSEANGWKATVSGLQKYSNGEKINYTWSESAVYGYVMSDMTVNGNTTTFTNKHIVVPKEEEPTDGPDDGPKDGPTDEPGKEPDGESTVTVNVKKVWVDNNNQDGLRPEYITVNLIGNGKLISTVQITEKDGWAYEFKDLAINDENGNTIVYGIMEEPVENYMAIIAGDMETGFTLTNKYTAPEAPVIIPDTGDDEESDTKVTPIVAVSALITAAGIVFFVKKKQHNA